MYKLKTKHWLYAAAAMLLIVLVTAGWAIAETVARSIEAADYVVALSSENYVRKEPEYIVIENLENVSDEPFVIPTAPISDDVPLSWELQQAVVDNCAEYGLDVEIILGIMEVESDFRLEADNGICYGVMQIHKGNKNWVKKNAGVEDIYDPVQNIRAGCWILSEGLALFGDIEKALVWYNAGEAYTDSSFYSRNVLAKAEAWASVTKAVPA